MAKEKSDFDCEPMPVVSGGMVRLLWVSRVAGLAPLCFVKANDGWRICLSSGWTVYGYIMITAVSLLAAACIIIEMFGEKLFAALHEGSRQLVWSTQVVLVIITAAASVYTAPEQMKSLLKILTHVNKINYGLDIDSSAVWGCTMGSLMYAQVSLCIIVCIIEMVIWAITLFDQSDILLFIIAASPFYYICYWIMQIRNVKFIGTVLYVKYSFKILNDNLEKLLESLDTEEMDSNKSTMINNYVLVKPNHEIKKLAKEHESVAPAEGKAAHAPESARVTVRRLALRFACLCDVVREVDRCHGFIVTLMLTSFLLHLICTPYFLVALSSDSGNIATIVHKVLLFFWCLFHTYNLVMTVEPCDLTHLEVERTHELVGHLMRCSHSALQNPLGMELEQFYNYLLLNEVRYRPLKLTTMSRSLVVTILGSITTYIVIILRL